ncbi:STAS domain-containing protein [Streptomyces bauhiniae]|uniref:STAS domain-containing protein n=1 Tax=Streptomyces bauhiniae TaxID=2340725 RepID=UPI0035E253CE
MTTAPAHRENEFTTAAATSQDCSLMTLTICGYLDFESADLFLADATQAISQPLGLHDLRIDCTKLDGVDSMGLSALLMLHRRTTAAGVRLCLDQRPAALERVLTITGTRAYFVPHHQPQVPTVRVATRRVASDAPPAQSPGT